MLGSSVGVVGQQIRIVYSKKKKHKTNVLACCISVMTPSADTANRGPDGPTAFVLLKAATANQHVRTPNHSWLSYAHSCDVATG